MKVWHEIDKDAATHFQWFSTEQVSRGLTNLPALTVFSVVGSMLFDTNDRMSFNKLCGIEVQKILRDQDFITDYKLYLFANVEIKEQQSRVARYKKVWRALNIEWQLNSFEKGSELEITAGEKTFFSSIARFEWDDFPSALAVVAKDPKKHTIVASKNDDFLSENNISNVFKVAFNENSKYTDEIDYFGLTIYLCQNDDVIFRWGDSSEEVELAAIIRKELINR